MIYTYLVFLYLCAMRGDLDTQEFIQWSFNLDLMAHTKENGDKFPLVARIGRIRKLGANLADLDNSYRGTGWR